MANPLIVDGRNLLDPETVRAAGFAYEGIGRPISRRRAADDGRARACQRTWRRSSSPAARPSGSATRPAAGRRRSSRSAGGRSPRTRSRRLARAGVDRVIVVAARPARASCSSASSPASARGRRGGGARAARPRRRDQVRRAGAPRDGDVFALNGDELVDVDFERAARAAPRDRRRRDDHRRRGRSRSSAWSSSTTTTSSRASRRRPTLPYWVNCGIYVFSDEVHRAPAGARRPRDDDVPGARRRAPPARLPPRRAVAHGEHAEGAAHGRGAPRGAPGWLSGRMSGQPAHPTWAFELAPCREALGLRADLGADGRLLRQAAVREGRPLALAPAPPREGRVVARPVGPRQGRARGGGRGSLRRGRVEPGAAFRFAPGPCTA